MDKMRALRRLVAEREATQRKTLANTELAAYIVEEFVDIDWLPAVDRLSFVLGLARAMEDEVLDHLETWALEVPNQTKPNQITE